MDNTRKISTDGTSHNDVENLKLNYKISDKKILEIRKIDENYVENNETQLLHFAACDNLKEAQEKIVKFNFKDFPKVFVVIITFLDKFDDDTKNIFNPILDKFTDNRPLLLQINNKNEVNFYFKQRTQQSFLEVNLNAKEDFIKSKLEKNGLTSDVFLMILNCSLLAADFSVIISYFGDKVPIELAVDSGDELCFRLINLFDIILPEPTETQILFSIIETKDFWMFLAFLYAFDETHVKDSQLEKMLSKRSNKDSQNVLMAAINSRNLEVSKAFLRLSKNNSDFFNFKLFEEALKVMKKNEFFVIFDILSKSYFKLSCEEEAQKQKLMLDTQEIIDIIANLHDNIASGNFDGVKTFANKYPHLRLCYGNAQVCALEYAMECNFFEIYAYLRSQGFYTDKGASFRQKIEKLSKTEKVKIRDENLRYFKSNPEALIGIILSKCTFDLQSPIGSNDIRRMLLEFKEIDEIYSMFPTVVHADVEIIFDYKIERLNSMDPMADEFTLGQAYRNKGLLYVGRNSSLNQRYGTFAHELTHMVYNLIYENKCLPYCKDDTEREREWIQIVEDLKIYCENNPKFTDNIVKWVFDFYEEGFEQRAEAAVRVNDMLASYHNNPAKIQELILQHPELFSYYRERVLSDFKIPNLYRMIKLNNDFGLIDRINESKLQVKPTENRNILDLATDDDNKILLVTNVPQLMLSKIFQEIKSLPGNKLNLKAKNFFVNQGMLVENQIEDEFKELNQTEGIERIIVDAKQYNEAYLDIFNDGNTKKFLVVSMESNLAVNFESKNYKKHEIIFKWQDLTEESQKYLLNKKINFQGTYKGLSEVLPEAQNLITPEILTTLCSDVGIEINCKKKLETPNLIPQTVSKIENSIKIDYSLESFIRKTNIPEELAKFVVISGIAASGKTTFLKEVHNFFNLNFPSNLTYFLSLYKFVDELSSGVGENFADFIIKILKLDELERIVFMQKYKKGEVKILFDAFDEISPRCKENALKLFKLFKPNGTNQMFITTRTNMLYELENELNVSSYMIEPMTRNDLVSYFIAYWKNTNTDNRLINTCANALADKILRDISPKCDSIGLPFIIQSLAKFFKNNINENIVLQIKSLNILFVFEKIIESVLNEFYIRYPEKIIEAQRKTTSLLQVHQSYALSYLLGEKLANSLGFCRDDEEWPPEEIARVGLISVNMNGSFWFNQKTIAEFLATRYLFEIIKNLKTPSVPQIDFLLIVLKEEKNELMRMFLNLMLERIKNIKDLKIFFSSGKISQQILKENPHNVLKFTCQEGHNNLFNFILSLMSDSIENTRFDKEFVEFLKNILTDEKFISLRKNIDLKTITPEFEKCLEIATEKDEDFPIVIRSLVNENLIVLLTKVLRINQQLKVDACKNTALKFDEKSNKNILMAIRENNFFSWDNFEEVFKIIQQLFGDEFSNFLSQVDSDGNNLFHIFLNESFASDLNSLFNNFSNVLKKIENTIEARLVFQWLFQVKNKNNLNVMSIIIKLRDINVINCMLSILNKVNGQEAFIAWKDATECSFYSEDIEIFNIIKNFSLSVMKEFSDEKMKFLEGFDKILNEIKEFHANIRNKEDAEVEEFVKKYPNLKYCYGNEGISAIEHCINCKNDEAFTIIYANSFKAFEGGNVDVKIKKFMKKVGLENRRKAKVNPNNHLCVLESMCRLSAKCPDEDFKNIRESFDVLNETKEHKNIMKVITDTNKNKPKIIFDTQNEDLGVILPEYKDEGTYGLIFPKKNELLIAKDTSKEARNGTIAHEMTHCALNIVYKNNCLPYEKLDELRRAKWQEIVEITKEMYEGTLNRFEEILNETTIKYAGTNTNIYGEALKFFGEDSSGMEPIIFNVFRCYKKELFEAELAVRVPHILAHYQNNQHKINELKLKHPSLFKFHDDYIEKDLEVECGTELRELNDDLGFLRETINFNEEFQTADKILTTLTENKNVIITKLQGIVANKIYNELKVIEPNLTLLRTKNVFINLDNKDSVKIIEKLNNSDINPLTSTSIERVIIQISEENEVFDEMLGKLHKNCKVLIITSDKSLISYQQVSKEYKFNDFTEESQVKLLKKEITCFKEKILLEDLILNNPNDKENTITRFLSHEVISEVIKSENLIINETTIDKENHSYISRVYKRSNTNDIKDEENFLINTRNEKVVLISDLVGSGKTETLKELSRKLKKTYPNYWISFLTLKDNKKEYLESKTMSFKQIMVEKILKLNKDDKVFERAIFEHLYDDKRVIFLFDGFDEISSYCKKEVIDIFKDFIKTPSYQIYISTRGHLEQDLEAALNVFAYKITPFTKNQQVEHLLKSWKDVDKVNDEIFARKLIENLSKYLKGTDFFGLPLQTYLLSEIFYEREMRNEKSELELTPVDIFSKFFEATYKMWKGSFDTLSDFSKAYDKNMHFNRIHEFLAILWFAGKQKKLFGMNYNDTIDWTADEIQSCRIVIYEEQKFRFIHQSFAEFLIARFIFKYLSNFSEASNEFVGLLLDVLCEDRFQVVRIFLNDMLKNLELTPEEFKEIAEKLRLKMVDREHFMITSKAFNEKLDDLYSFVSIICSHFDDETIKRIEQFVNPQKRLGDL